jgi:hypothetical protein
MAPTNQPTPVEGAVLTTFGPGEFVAGTTVTQSTYVTVAPGTYKTTANVGADCYWYVYAAGYPPVGLDHWVISQSSWTTPVQGTQPTMKLMQGQSVQMHACGTWTLMSAANES